MPTELARAAAAELLPLRALSVTLRFNAPSRPRFFHQSAVHAFVRHLLGGADDFADYLRIDCPETGRVSFEAGDAYRFGVIVLRGGEGHLADLMVALRRLPMSAPQGEPQMPFADNCELVLLEDLFSEQPIESPEDLSAYDADTLAEEATLWAGTSELVWRWLSPVRLLRAKGSRQGLRGEARYCRDRATTPAELLFERLADAITELLRRRGESGWQRPPIQQLQTTDTQLFWIDHSYVDKGGDAHSMGGMAGEHRLSLPVELPGYWWPLLVLGQYLGIGQRTAFGWGRYRLEGADGAFSLRRLKPAQSLLARAAEAENLAEAWRHVAASSGALAEQTQTAWPGEGALDDAEEEESTSEHVVELMAELHAGRYRAPELTGVLIEKNSGGVRPLCIPPFSDRVLQRAVAQVLTPGLEQVMYSHSYGYRRGRSRITASHAIQRAWREGYRWVYESDIDDFFDSVRREHLTVRLRSLYGDDPIIDAVIEWMAASVRFDDQLIERHLGLPQGSPLSPLMSNLMLDDFDSDMRDEGFRLVRFADDFVVLCKSPQEAERAAEVAQASLAEHGLALNEDKTHTTDMADGFRYLGYLFVNDLALDVSGSDSSRDAGAGPEPVPPNSWLARVAEHPVREIKAGEDFSRLAEQLRRGHGIAVGEREGEGTLLCVTGESAMLVTRNKRVQVMRDDQLVCEQPWRGLQAVILFGNHHITTPALRAACAAKVPVHLATGVGRYQGVLWSGEPGPNGHALWLDQLACFAEPERALGCAREVVAARMRHMHEVLRQRGRTESLDAIAGPTRKLNAAENIDSLRGLEGAATRAYYGALAELISEEWGFDGRNRRPPRDPFNALLSLGYTLMHGYVDSVVRAVGFLPWQGFYHVTRGTHPALASDLVEPFRHVVERVALKALLSGEFTTDDFSSTPAGACIISNAARRQYLAKLTQRLEQPIRARGAESSQRFIDHMHTQALSLLACVRDGEPFQAFRLR